LGLWGGSSPEESAEEALDRTARKMCEGEAIQNVPGFVLGVARLVHKERVKREIRERKAVEELRRAGAGGRDPAEEERRLSCYEHCLGALPADERNLFRRYYQEEEGHRQARQREELCRQQGITLNVLRVRAFRLRKSLAQCARNCLERPS
jgi:hypothetical protein